MAPNKPKIIAIILARMGSGRLSNKPLAPILGMPRLGHCYFGTKMCDLYHKDTSIANRKHTIGWVFMFQKNLT